ncbi:MAG TPA: SGNH/GDSL hydrolase family protein [Nocardioides sp.]|nr:SGNH/GDSL hydrolase family protein [Nocardioides sp.]
MVLSVPLAPPAGAETVYVALGDSFASGVGTRTYYDDSGSCYRSPKAYPVLDAARIEATLVFVACSGANVPEVRAEQVPALTEATTLVTVQVGGNDAGFGKVISTCAQPWWAADCHGVIDDAQTFIAEKLGGRLDNLYGDIEARAGDAGVVVVGYPRLFNGEDCNAGTWFSKKEMTRLNQTADQLNAKIKARATAAGYAFADPTRSYVGHAVCADVEWVNGLSDPLRESYHPNVKGQKGYADLVDDFLG